MSDKHLLKSKDTVVAKQGNIVTVVMPQEMTAFDHLKAAGQHLKAVVHPNAPAKEAGRSFYGFIKRALYTVGNAAMALWKAGKSLVAATKAAFHYGNHLEKERKVEEAREFDDGRAIQHFQKASEYNLEQSRSDLRWSGDELYNAAASAGAVVKNAAYTAGNGVGTVYYAGDAVIRSVYNEGITNSIYAIPNGICEVARGFAAEALSDIESFYTAQQSLAPVTLVVQQQPGSLDQEQAQNADKLALQAPVLSVLHPDASEFSCASAALQSQSRKSARCSV